jgi:hypothetical protein
VIIVAYSVVRQIGQELMKGAVSEVFAGHLFFAINSRGKTEVMNLGRATPD